MDPYFENERTAFFVVLGVVMDSRSDAVIFRNDLLCVEWDVKLYTLTQFSLLTYDVIYSTCKIHDVNKSFCM